MRIFSLYMDKQFIDGATSISSPGGISMSRKLVQDMNVEELLARAKETKILPEDTHKRFEKVNPQEYGNNLNQHIPDCDYAHDLLLQAIAPYLERGGQMIDLGGGTGRLAGQTLERFKGVHATVADYSPNMLSGVSQRLAAYENRYSTRVINLFDDNFDFGKGVFDVAASSMAIHHGQGADAYSGLYQRIYRWLATPGIFINLDHVLGSSHELTVLNVKGWKRFLDTMSAPTNRMICGTYREDTPLSLENHFQLLKKAGFKTTDVLWKKFNFALYVAIKV